MRYQETVLQRDCQVVAIPDGFPVTLAAGTPVVITQELGDSFTLQAPTLGGLYRLNGIDADAIGRERPVQEQAVDPNAPVEEERVWQALRKVYDPEIPVNIVELGLVYDMQVEHLETGGSRVFVRMTLTAPGCGMGPVIASDARAQIERIPGVKEAEVEVVFDPPWNQSMMSEAAKLELGMF